MPSICKFIIRTHVENVKRIIKSVRLKIDESIALEGMLDDIKKYVLDMTEEYINNHRRRPVEYSKTNLIDVLRETSFVEKIDDYTYRLVLGNEAELNKRVPYWYVVNYGGIPPDWEGHRFYGIFTDGRPTKGGKGATWIEGGTDNGKMYLMKPKNPIPPMHYLNYMAQEFKREIKRLSVGVKQR